PSRAMQRVLNDLAALPFVTVAAINGPALGGGLEIALACDTRIAADAPNVRVGLTETRLGLIPAAGGTQRLPRLIGLPRALDMILTARQLTPKRALRAGVIDEVVHPAVLLRAAIDHAGRDPKRKPRGGATVVERAATHFAPARAFALRQARARTLAETKGRYPAPLAAIDAVATSPPRRSPRACRRSAPSPPTRRRKASSSAAKPRGSPSASLAGRIWSGSAAPISSSRRCSKTSRPNGVWSPSSSRCCGRRRSSHRTPPHCRSRRSPARRGHPNGSSAY